MMDETMESLFRKKYQPGSVIFREGEAGDSAFVIERGRVEISALRNKERVVIASLAEGELFGEMALIDGQVRSATARAADETTLIIIARDQVERKIDKVDPLLNLFLKVIMNRLRSTTRLLDLHREHLDGAETSKLRRIDTSFMEVRDHAMNQLKVEQELSQAIQRSEFELFYQPVAATADFTIAGAEALIRWRHPERGVVSPSEFIELAEDTGLIIPIGLWVLETACEALKPYNDSVTDAYPNAPHSFMSVNLSARQIIEPGLPEAIYEILTRTDTDPKHLKLEVTESVIMEDPETAAIVLGELKSLGFTLAVDDFGTGYSSLSYLQRFPIDIIKIDRSFVNGMLEDSANLKIVRGIISLARELGMQVIAEGVERQEHLTLLRDFECDYAQGYLFSKPVTLDEITAAIRQRLAQRRLKM